MCAHFFYVARCKYIIYELQKHLLAILSAQRVLTNSVSYEPSMTTFLKASTNILEALTFEKGLDLLATLSNASNRSHEIMEHG